MKKILTARRDRVNRASTEKKIESNQATFSTFALITEIPLSTGSPRLPSCLSSTLP